MATMIIGILQLIACLYVLVRGIQALNHMSSGTSHPVRFAYITMTAGAAYGAMTAHEPNLSGMLMAAGVALYLFGDRRNATHYAVR